MRLMCSFFRGQLVCKWRGNSTGRYKASRNRRLAISRTSEHADSDLMSDIDHDCAVWLLTDVASSSFKFGPDFRPWQLMGLTPMFSDIVATLLSTHSRT